MQWINALQAKLTAGQACVLVTISDVQGSAPRRVGARMLVGADNTDDTIGGGELEQQAIEQARSLLNNARPDPIITSKTSVLGSDLTQCCGGKVTLHYEYHPARTFNVVVFGAGHVAQCIAKLLVELPCNAQFYDSRTEWLDRLPSGADSRGTLTRNNLPANVFTEVEACPSNAFYLVMTHNHELDFDLVEAILSKGDSAYCGLIASKSKATKFRSRLSRKGFTVSELDKLTAPIGKEQLGQNLPMEVAIAAMHEILKVRDVVESAAGAGSQKSSVASSVPEKTSASVTRLTTGEL